MNKNKRLIFLVSLASFFLIFNWLIFQKEQNLNGERVLLLELGGEQHYYSDYHSYNTDRLDALSSRFLSPKAKNEWDSYYGENLDVLPARGYAIFALDAQRVGTFKRLQAKETPLEKEELAVRYFGGLYSGIEITPNQLDQLSAAQQVWLDSTAYYGSWYIAKDGTAMLKGIHDQTGKLLIKKEY